LQQDLRGDLVDHAALVARFAPAFPQGALGGDSGQAFVPKIDGTGDAQTQFFRESA
jgi:hypothetical protein